MPASFAWLFFMAGPDSGERFWSIVLPAVLGSYAMLPWVPTRPPRAIEPPGAMDRRALRVRHLNLWVLKHTSIQANTVPSGHVAGAFATALALAASAPIAATVFGTIALSIAAASVLGRYHYLTAAWLGLLVAVATWAVMG